MGRAVAAVARTDLSDDELNSLVFEVEKLHHGSPSGIDNTVVVFEKSVYFVRGAEPDFVNIVSPLNLIFADTGIAAYTRETVAHVHERVRSRPASTGATLRRIGQIVDAAREVIGKGALTSLGELLNENHKLLCDLGVSSPELDRLVVAAQAGGAIGAKLSGGGRGGVIVALVEPPNRETVIQRLQEAGAVRLVQATVGGARTIV